MIARRTFLLPQVRSLWLSHAAGLSRRDGERPPEGGALRGWPGRPEQVEHIGHPRALAQPPRGMPCVTTARDGARAGKV